MTTPKDRPLTLEIDWSLEIVGVTEDSDAATEGVGQLWIGSKLVWSTPKAVKTRLQWVDLLRHLADNWTSLLYEQDPPAEFGLTDVPAHLRFDFLALRAHFEREWATHLRYLTGEALENAQQKYLRAEERLYAYEDRHNLAAAFEVGGLPQVMVFRDDGYLVLASEESAVLRFPFAAVARDLECIGETIVSRIAHLTSDRAKAAVASWRSKEPTLSAPVVRIATGLSDDKIALIERGRSPKEVWDQISDRFELTECLAAARMSSSKVGPEAIRAICSSIRALTKSETTELDRWSAQASEHVNNDSRVLIQPHEQGYRLAHWLRNELKLAVGQQSDPEELLRRLNVEVLEVDIDDLGVEAIGVWGMRRGPAVLINRRSDRAQYRWGRRSILSHELCHLLVDRRHALPLAEVMDGRLNPAIEKRAGAFGAEFLAPREAAARIYLRLRSAKPALTTISNHFEISHQMAAHQLQNHEVIKQMSEDDRAIVEMASAG